MSDVKQPAQNITEIPSGYPVPVFIQHTFIHRPISSKIPNYEPLNCDYNNLDEFSERFSEKINSQLMTIDKKDVESLINKIQYRTKADLQIIKNVLYKLTIVSSNHMLYMLSGASKKFDGGYFDLSALASSEKDKDYSLNAALSYLAQNKKMIKNSEPLNKFIFILDDIFLKQLEKAKTENTTFYKNLMNLAKDKKLILINIPGWDIKCSDNKYRSANFLLGNSMLEDLACDVIKRVQKGENADDIIKSDLDKRAYNIFENKDIIKLCVFNNNENATVNDILENLNNCELSKNKIQKEIQWAKNKKFLPEHLKETLFKYLDEASIVYSNDSMAQELIKLHKKISLKYGNDVYYIIPEFNKSYGYITSIFVKLNEIDTEKMQKQKSKNIFVLDDITASGQSMTTVAQEQKTSVNFAYILASPSALNFDWTDKKPKNINDIIYNKKLKCAKKDYTNDYKLVRKNEIEQLAEVFKYSLDDLNISCAFPHNIPDNINIISANIFNRLLMSNTKNANKAISQTNNLVFKKNNNGERLAYYNGNLISGKYLLYLKSGGHAELCFTDGKINFCTMFDNKGRLLYQKEYETLDDGTKLIRISNNKNEITQIIHYLKNTWYTNLIILDRKKKIVKEVSEYKKDKNSIITKNVIDDKNIQVKKIDLLNKKTETYIESYVPHIQKVNNETTIIAIDK